MTKRPLILIIAFCFILAASCDRKRNDKGYEYFPDMAHSLAYETYEPNPVTESGTTMILPAPHTVPLEMIPYPYTASADDRELAMKQLVNPFELTEEGLVRGKEQYNIFCANCHGEKGNGEGFLFLAGKYKARPASLISDKMVLSNEADIFHVITVGYQLMGPHGPMIRPDDRWMISMYVKNELQKQ
jgi:mono/diheme cytochrome c family protein